MCRGIFTGEGRVRTIQKVEGNNNTKHFEKALSIYIILCFLRKCLCVLKWNYYSLGHNASIKICSVSNTVPSTRMGVTLHSVKDVLKLLLKTMCVFMQDLEELRWNYVEPCSLSASSQTLECINQTFKREKQITFLPNCNVH